VTQHESRARRLAAELTPDQSAALLASRDAKEAASEAAVQQIHRRGYLTADGALTPLGRQVAALFQTAS
jgi:hypothetical protein